MEFEQKILVAAANLSPKESDFQQLAVHLSRLPDKRRLIELAVKEGLAGFLYKSLLKANLLETLQPLQKKTLYSTYYLTIRRNLKLIHALNQIAKQLNENQVQVVLMQGISLLLLVYRDIGLRPMNDMDFWVLPTRYADFVDCLTGQGFERNAIYPDTFSKGEVALDIHTHFLWGERIKSRAFLIQMDQEHIFRNSRPLNAENTTTRCLNPADQFLYLSLHALKHNLERLIWMVDIKILVADWKTADWFNLLTRAEYLGLQSTVSYTLFLLAQIFAMRLPTGIVAHLDDWSPNPFARRILNRRIDGRPIPTWSQLMLISAGKGLRKRLALVRETLFPRAKILRQVFPDSHSLNDRELYRKRASQILGSLKSK
jgi:hypothetical protein